MVDSQGSRMPTLDRRKRSVTHLAAEGSPFVFGVQAAMTVPVTLCGSLSRLASPLGRSMHEAGYRALGLAFTYVPFEVGHLPDAIAGMRALGIRGFGVSQPFKQEVIPMLDALEPTAQRIGAVNTIVNDGGRLVGHNTDWIGAMRALEEARPLAGARVLLVGAGGAARAIAFGLRDRGARTTIANRDPRKAETLAAEVGARGTSFEEAARAVDYDVVINATVLGQRDGDVASPIAESAIRPGQIVMDIVYKPVRTVLIDTARGRGAVAIHGGRMLLHQAAAQFEIYTGCPAPLETMEAALRAAIG
jgi:shikimate dehydrogenase